MRFWTRIRPGARRGVVTVPRVMATLTLVVTAGIVWTSLRESSEAAGNKNLRKPFYDRNAVFIDDSQDPEAPAYMAANIDPAQVLGRTVLGADWGNFETGEIGRVAFLASNIPGEFWWIATDGYGRIFPRKNPDGTVQLRYVSNTGSSGYIVTLP